MVIQNNNVICHPGNLKQHILIVRITFIIIQAEISLCGNFFKHFSFLLCCFLPEKINMRDIFREFTKNNCKCLIIPDYHGICFSFGFRRLCFYIYRIFGRCINDFYRITLFWKDYYSVSGLKNKIPGRIKEHSAFTVDTCRHRVIDSHHKGFKSHTFDSLKINQIKLWTFKIEQLPERLWQTGLSAGMSYHFCQNAVGLKGRNIICLRNWRRETVLILRYDSVHTDLRNSLFVEQSRHGKNRLNCSHILCRADNDRLTCFNRTLFQRGRIGDVCRPADDSEVFRNINVLGYVLFHLLPIHIFRYYYTCRLSCSRKNQLAQQCELTGVKSKDDNMILFQYNWISTLQLINFLFDCAGDNANQNAGKQHADYGNDWHKEQITRTSILKTGHPAIDYCCYTVPENRSNFALFIKSKHDDKTGNQDSEHDWRRYQHPNKAKRPFCHSIIEPVIKSIL